MNSEEMVDLSDAVEADAIRVSFGDASEPEIYVRVNITRNSKGFTTDSTVSVTGFLSDEEMAERIRSLLRIADTETKQEIARREEGATDG